MGEAMGGGGVVSAIENEALGDGLESAWPVDGAEGFGEERGREVEAGEFEGVEGEGGVPALVIAGEGDGEIAEWGGNEANGGVSVEGDLDEEGADFVGLGGGDDGDMGFDNAGFFEGDGWEGIAEIGLVIPVDLGDHGDEGGDDIGGIEAPTEAGFEDDEVELGAVEVGEG